MAKITVTEAARVALLDAKASHQDAPLRLAITDSFDHQLYFDERTPNDEDLYAGAGVTLIVDAITMQRADGMTIDFVDRGPLQGFKIENPNAPPKVRQLPPLELKSMLEAEVTLELVDVRTPEEREVAALPGSRLLDQTYVDELLTRDRNATLVFYCHHGMRSQAAAEYFLGNGFRHLYNLTGGIDAWSRMCDPNVPRY